MPLDALVAFAADDVENLFPEKKPFDDLPLGQRAREAGSQGIEHRRVVMQSPDEARKEALVVIGILLHDGHHRRLQSVDHPQEALQRPPRMVDQLVKGAHAIDSQNLLVSHAHHPRLQILHILRDYRELQRHVEHVGEFQQPRSGGHHAGEIRRRSGHPRDAKLGRPAVAQAEGLDQRRPLQALFYVQVHDVHHPLALESFENCLIRGEMSDDQVRARGVEDLVRDPGFLRRGVVAEPAGGVGAGAGAAVILVVVRDLHADALGQSFREVRGHSLHGAPSR
ncbi:hypothetical protein Mapa_017530 [Marchantia paleacea]|nr:hypothetical protein Mapa_017530 [Marchantia paleacea]